jgi:actin-related protein
MFESFNTPLLHLGISSVLSLYAAGKTTGIVIESGHGTTCTVPIYEGHMLSDATNCINFGGQDLTTHLVTLLEKKGHSLTIHDHDIIHTEIKEKLCFVSANEQVLEKSRYELPDGYILKIGNEKFQCPEALFQPNGVHLLTYDSITKCDSDIRKEMYNSIVLAGGSTLFPGMKDRISLEMYYLAPAMKINVTISQHVVQHNQEVSCWVGGSMLGSLSLKPWITAKEYEEFGPSNVHRKCF